MVDPGSKRLRNLDAQEAAFRERLVRALRVCAADRDSLFFTMEAMIPKGWPRRLRSKGTEELVEAANRILTSRRQLGLSVDDCLAARFREECLRHMDFDDHHRLGARRRADRLLEEIEGSASNAMRTSVLRAFLLGEASGAQLAADLAGTRALAGDDTVHHRMVDDAPEETRVESAHLVALCDAVLAGDLAPELLEVIGFGMIASDRFTWDEDGTDGVGETVWDWSAPEVNFALRLETVRKFRHRLLTGEDTFTSEDRGGHPPAGRRIVVWDPAEGGEGR